MNLKNLLVVVTLFSAMFFVGCGEPSLNPVAGKVTLGGKSYERLLVYFRPIDDQATVYNMGVGETDAEGNLALRSTAGQGLARGKYRVFFSCVTMQGQSKAVGMDEKADDNRNARVIERVPQLYTDEQTSPVEFEIRSGENNFIFDIPVS